MTAARSRQPWMLALLLILAAAVTVRAATVNRYLPVIEDDDEMRRTLNALYIRHDAPLAEDFGGGQVALPGFPPGQLWTHAWAGRALEQVMPFPFPSDYIRVNRYLSAALSVVTAALLMGAGGLLAGGWGALFAGLMWGLSPYIVRVSNLSYADPLLYPLLAGAFLLAVLSIQRDSGWAAFGSLLCVIAAIYVKYVLIYALWLPAGAVFMMLRRRGWRRILPWVAVMAVVSAVTAGYLLWGYGALTLDNRETDIFYESGLANMLSPARNWENLRFTLATTVTLAGFAAGIVWGGVSAMVARRRGWRVLEWRWLWLILPVVVGGFMLTSSIDVVSRDWLRLRYTLAPLQGLILVWAMAVAQGLLTLDDALPRRGWATALGGGLAVMIAAPMLAVHADDARQFSQTHTHEIVWDWANASLPAPAEGTMLLSRGSDLRNIWNRAWSGYNGPIEFPYAYDENPAQRTPEDLAQNAGVMYFAATDRDLATVYDTPAMQGWLDGLLHLKTLPPGEVEPYTAHVYRLLPPQASAQAAFGDEIALVGYDLSQDEAAPGDVLTLRPYWQALRTPSANYSMFVHLIAEDDPAPLVQFDGPPVNAARLPLTWDDPAETLIGNVAALALPADLPPGDYMLALGLYNFETGARLPTTPDSNAFRIPVRVGTR